MRPNPVSDPADSRQFSAGARAFVAVACVLAAVLQLVTIGCSSHGCSAQSKGNNTMGSSTADDVLARLERTGKLNGAEIEYYVGGGLPPPATRNDQLRLFTREGREVVEFARSNFKRTEFNPYALDIYQLPAEPADVRTIARLIRATNAFTTHFPEETVSGSADMLHTDVVVTDDGDTATRTYYGHVPQVFAPLEKEVEAMIERLKAKGKYGLYADERQVEGAVRP